jgi:two-component system chemotaxis response regulator CheY
MAVNVLIVDDSGVMRSMIHKSLQLSGLDLGEVHQAGNGREGLDILDRHWIDLVIADINMPVMTGEEMVMRMQDNPGLAGIPTIVVSTEGSRVRIARLENLGVRFIHKPFTPERMRDTLREVLGAEVFHEHGH